jgi:preprotein translocase SecE subunit
LEANVRKFTVLTFVIFAVLFGYVFYRALGQVLDWMRLTNTVTAAVGGYAWPVVGGVFSGFMGFALLIGLSLNQKATQFFDEVFGEAYRVTWSSGKETYASTVVVVIMVFIAGLMLFLLDNIWNWFFQLLLS